MAADSPAARRVERLNLAESLLAQAQELREDILSGDQDVLIALRSSSGRISLIGSLMKTIGIEDPTRQLTQAYIDLARRCHRDEEKRFLDTGLTALDEVITRLGRWIERKKKYRISEVPQQLSGLPVGELSGHQRVNPRWIALWAKDLAAVIRRCAPLRGQHDPFPSGNIGQREAATELSVHSDQLRFALDPSRQIAGSADPTPYHLHYFGGRQPNPIRTELLKLWDVFHREFRKWNGDQPENGEPVDPADLACLESAAQTILDLLGMHPEFDIKFDSLHPDIPKPDGWESALKSNDAGQAPAAAGETESPETWPPDAGWHFRPGEAAYFGVVIPITGKLWGVLKALADARGAALTWCELSDAISPDTTPEPQAIRGYVSRVRAALRHAFGLDSSIDPVPNVEWGDRTSWRLDSQALRVAAQKQR
jgi:hypothetical protein